MNSAFSKLKLGLSGKDKIDTFKRIEDINSNNKITVQPSDYSGILKAKINNKRKVINGKKYKGILSCGILTLRRLNNKKLEKNGVESKPLNNIIVDLGSVNIFYDEVKCFFIFNFPNTCLRIKTKQKEFDSWKKMICQHKWYNQYINNGNGNLKREGLKFLDLESDDDNSEYTEDSSKRTNISEEGQKANVSKSISQIVQTKDTITKNDKTLTTTSKSSVCEKKIKNASKENLFISRSPEVIEEMMELIKLLMSTVQTMNDRIIKLEMSVSIKDIDSNKDSPRDTSEKINDIKDKNEETITSNNLKEIQSNKKNESISRQINNSYPLSPNVDIEKMSFSSIDYKNRKRREILPATQTIPENLSYTQIFKCLFSGGNLPITIYEPISSLQLLCCELQNAKILNNISNLDDPIERILKVAEFVIGSSSDCLIPGRRKCFSTFPGETFDYISNDGWKFHGEHILKSPMTIASYIEHETWEMFMSAELHCHMSYNVVEINSNLPIRLNIQNKESFIWKKPKFIINNLKGLPKNRQPYYNDTINITNSDGLTIELTFNKKAEIEGNYFSVVTYTIKSKKYTLYTAPNISTYNENFYSFNKFTIGINELLNDEIPYIARSDSRLRNDIRYLEQGLIDKSYNEKILLSEKYKTLTEHIPLWFTKVYDQFSKAILYKSNFKYWQSKMEKFNTEEEIILFFIYFGWIFAQSIESPGIYQKICLIYYNESNIVDCTQIEDGDVEDEIQQRTAQWYLYTSLSYMIPALFVDTILGAYGLAFTQFFYIIILNPSINAPYWIMIPVLFLSGFTGFINTIPASCNAYLADQIADTSSLTIRSGILSLFQLVASSLGGVCAGLLFYISITTAIIIELAIFFIAFLIVLWKIKHYPNKIRTFSIEPIYEENENDKNNTSFLGTFKNIIIDIKYLLINGWRTYTKKRSGNKRIFMWITGGALMISYTTSVETRISSVMNSYAFRRTDDDALNWDSKRLGFWNGIGYGSLIVGTFIGVFIFKRIFKFQETTLIIISLLSSSGRLFLIAFATTDLQMYLANVCGCFASLIQPATVSFIAQLVSLDEVGRAFALFGVGSNITFLIINFIFSSIYIMCEAWMPGFLFLFIGVIQIIFVIAILWVHYQSKLEGISAIKTVRANTAGNEQRPRMSIDITSFINRHFKIEQNEHINDIKKVTTLTSLKKVLRKKLSQNCNTNEENENTQPTNGSVNTISTNLMNYNNYYERRASIMTFH
ncbi:Oxysterol-binding protein family and Major facilitator superfamily domain, general substrate transporter-containing protein [Strongyloides ratti]|uniref:Oxysterol-binding protein family and Major facilitator superfamily domain, general substrate transporter-containing protein n=1 Tax=Strongyloides ratti TaxID=34506 RepID=A0A090KZF9_STRRB|nr:Oxysterol-binding protein family and Major facilitator superfamily domain, general substrate transporter-containing protein [Strongyloides ratti]CEF61222.1 Oxysterol-binding protein family and Major facilitator superfamily domain, general substrate transporter-containing protein [Strongyloides ratti]